MAKDSSKFQCSNCGARYAKWSGRCEKCDAWNSLEEIEAVSLWQGAAGQETGQPVKLTGLDCLGDPPERSQIGIGELDRVLGGGIAPASATLVGGDPGIGKSTLLLQAAAGIAAAGGSTVYVSGEEAASQIALRAARLGLEKAPVLLGTETNIANVLATLDSTRPKLAIIDSVQTMWSAASTGAPGSTSQVRAVAFELVRYAKLRGTAVFLVGHVTKDGQIAGPKVIEHMVDTVLYFEGERGHQFRILRTVKNRYGPTNEVGVFEMTGRGLEEVANPSALFLSEREKPTPGSTVFAGIEGTRPLLVEFQALVAQSSYATPRRTVVGSDGNRMAMIIAVLESRCGISFAGLDVFLNTAGGIRVTEPAADLAVAGALVSSLYNRALPSTEVTFGEISLSGAIRSVSQTESRLVEAAKLGFTTALIPRGSTSLSEGLINAKRLGDLPELMKSFIAPKAADSE